MFDDLDRYVTFLFQLTFQCSTEPLTKVRMTINHLMDCLTILVGLSFVYPILHQAIADQANAFIGAQVR